MIYNLTINVKKIRTQFHRNGKLAENVALKIALIETRLLGEDTVGV